MSRKYLLFTMLLALFAPMQAQNKSLFDEAQIRKIQMAEFAISTFYVDSVDEKKLVEDGIIGMLKELDPHSSYSNAEEVKKLNEPLQGNFEGIGVQFNIVEDTLLVIQPTTKGPSEKVGIVAGDRIISVNDTAIAGVKMEQSEIMKRLRGPKGSQVKLGIVRRGVSDVLYFNVTREKIPVHSMDAAYMVTPTTGYVRFGNFANTTHQEMLKALAKMSAAGMKNLILDLQDNGGGYLHAAVAIANEFLEKDDMIVYTEGNAQRREEYRANGKGNFKDIKLIVLVNQNSASAAEIVTGAIQDHDRGIIVGRRTFGKGLVQRPIDLPDGSMIRLTVARYYTPSGRCIQKPYEKGDKDSYNHDILNRLNNGELLHADSVHVDNSLKFNTLKKGRVVYGGGGVMPDYFVPLDTTQYNKYHRELLIKSAFVKSTLKYIDANRKVLKNKYNSFETFNKQFEVGKELLDRLIAEGKEVNVPYNEAQFKEALPLIKKQLKALVARDLWDMSEYYQIMNTENECLNKALELL